MFIKVLEEPLKMGDIKNIREDKNLGKVNNQKFHKWFYSRLTDKINYKAEDRGIPVEKQEGSYSSQCSPYAIEDLNNHQNFEGQQSKFKNKYPNSCFGDEAKFNEVKNRIISNLMKTEFENSTYYNNSIAKKNGWKLNFDLKGGNRAFDSIEFITFVQNDELKVVQAYDSYGFGSAKIVEKRNM